MTGYAVAPQDDEVEISIFGKGVGECIVIKAANGAWIIIDSFLVDNAPIALTYLSDIGVPPGQVPLVLATHWHDDHIRGITKVASECKAAYFAYSTVMCRDEFKGAVSSFSPAPTEKFSSGVNELIEMSAYLETNPHLRVLASSRTILFESGLVRVEALSPSNEDVIEFLREIEQWSQPAEVERVLVKPRRNDTSVACVVHVMDDLFLFGADLEVGGALTGWEAVCNLAWGSRGRCSFYKVAHHGSPTAHFEPVWAQLLEANPGAAVTAFGKGRRKLPDEADLQRIYDRTKRGFAAGESKLVNAKRQHNSVERTLAESEIKLWRVRDSLGHVRFRKKPGTDWRVECFGRANAIDPNSYTHLT